MLSRAAKRGRDIVISVSVRESVCLSVTELRVNNFNFSKWPTFAKTLMLCVDDCYCLRGGPTGSFLIH